MTGPVIGPAVGAVGGSVTVRVPAKVNLHLGVGPARPDGYHPLATVYQSVGVYDEVLLRPARRRSLTVLGDDAPAPAVPTGPANLAWRALDLLGEHHGLRVEAEVVLRKRIPVAGGLAGGSADAAAALVGADALLGLGTPHEELLVLGGRLGSDVPFCLAGGTALGSGRGELLTSVATAGEYWWALVTDQEGLSTPAVYAGFDRLAAGRPVPEPRVPDVLLTALAAGDVEQVGAALSNDLQSAALAARPRLGAVLRAGLAASAYGAVVSGSGPTVALLCGSADHAAEVDRVLRREHGTAPALVARGDVPGARLLEAVA